MARRKRKSSTKKPTSFSYNRVLKLSDFDSLGVNTRKDWEVAMALKTLREQGITSPDAIILGVGAAKERTVFELANGKDCRFVIPSDLYFNMGAWADWAGTEFVKHPGLHVPDGIECDHWRILPRHADMCNLPFPDNSIDGIFSSGSIEHVGKAGIFDGDAIAQAAREIGRVLRPGGVASISTEWKIWGDGWGWSHVRLFDEYDLMKYIVGPSGLEMIDELDDTFDGDFDDAMSLPDYVQGRVSEEDFGLISDHDFLFTSVHVALRKPTVSSDEKVVIAEDANEG